MILILGAGPAGLSAAYHLKNKTLCILEKENIAGGLCRSFNLGDTILDYGGHAFFTKHDYVRELIRELCPVELTVQPRSAWIYSHDTFIPYPFQANLYGLPIPVVKECLSGIIEVSKNPPQHPPNNIREWIFQSFGEGISKHFMLPYNEKIWAHPLETLLPTWAGDRIVHPNVDEILTGALTRVDFKNYPNAQVTYPSEGGFSALYEGFVDHLPPNTIQYQQTVERIDLTKRQVHTREGKVYDYERLISTLPLTELVAKTVDMPVELQACAQELQHFSLYLVNLVYQGNDFSDKQRVYCADPAVPFHKLVLNANSSEWLRKKPCFSFQAEVSFSPYKAVSSASLLDDVIKTLLEMGLITPKHQLLAHDIRTLPLAYPVYTAHWASARQRLFDFYESHGVFAAGRFGEWLYINSDTAVLRGQKAAEKASS